MSNIDNARSTSDRTHNQREFDDYTFEEPDNLAIPEEVKDRFADEGMVLRWIRVSIMGKDDVTNVGKRMQDGWQFVTPDEVPELMYNSVEREEGRYMGTVSRGDLALAKAPAGRMAARQAFYENRSREMIDSVEAQLQKHNDRRAPIQNSSSSKVIRGRNPSFQD